MDLSEEVPGAYQSKTQSLRDKFKKRRKAIESLLTGEENIVETTTEEEHQPSPAKRVSLPSSVAGDDNNVIADSSDTKKESQQSSNGAGASLSKSSSSNDVTALLSMQSTLEKEERSQHDEIFSLLSQPTAREQCLLNTFKSADGGGVKEFCQHSTKIECCKVNKKSQACSKLHFVKILQKHTDESLGDCSFLNLSLIHI